MAWRFRGKGTMRNGATFLLLLFLNLKVASAQAADQPARPDSSCHIEATNYKGWSAQQLSNRWLKLEVIPQNGGRLIQVTFAGHSFLFVNPEYEGKYLPPDPNRWFNYGGDKIWLLPEGNNDEQHWVGNSDVIDDGPYTFRKLSEGRECEIELTGPVDPQTGIQIRRTILLDPNSPHIHFHATMQNKTGHVIEWSIQSVSQYNTADPSNPSHNNPDFWTFTPANPSSSYLNRYHVRFGPAENPAVSVRDDGFFALHYVHRGAELWLDSTPGWVAVVDGTSRYAMVERFRYEKNETYPGKASVIFWTNGPEMRLSPDGEPSIPSGGDGSPRYLEAELNSPLVELQPGETRDFDTDWFPTRTGGSEFHGVEDAGIVIRPLRATLLETGHLRLSGSFGVFFPGRLVAHLYSEHGSSVGTMPLTQVDPAELVVLETELTPSEKPARISLHLEDASGLDRGSLQEIPINTLETH